MKKVFTLIMAAAMVTGAFGGCGKKDKEETADASTSIVEDYIEGQTSKSGGKKYYTATLLGDAIKELKDDDEWDDMIEDYNDSMEDMLEDSEIKVKNIDKGDKLSKDELKAAEEYLKNQCDRYDIDDEVSVKSGYEYKVKLKYREDKDDDWETNTQKLCAVEVKGDGWKVIGMEAKYLEEYYGDSDSD